MAPHLDSIVVDAQHPATLGAFWSQALVAPITHQGADGVRLALPGVPQLFLDFVSVADREPRPHRLHLDLSAGRERDAVVDRLIGLGARHVDVGQRDVPWVVLADPEDYAFCVMPERAEYVETGPIGAIPIDAEAPGETARFWAAASGWTHTTPTTLRHPTRRGLLLAFCDPVEPKRGKNPMHLDLRVDHGDDYDQELSRLLDGGAVRLEHGWGDLPWTVLLDPGGNEFCLLRASSAA